jgi:hypothetical protein
MEATCGYAVDEKAAIKSRLRKSDLRKRLALTPALSPGERGRRRGDPLNLFILPAVVSGFGFAVNRA